jgi:hypothetical protein
MLRRLADDILDLNGHVDLAALLMLASSAVKKQCKFRNVGLHHQTSNVLLVLCVVGNSLLTTNTMQEREKV